VRVNPKQIYGPWRQGWVLDKHTMRSVHVGDDAQGRPRFDTARSEAGEATYQLKYRGDFEQARPLAQALAEHICPKFGKIGFIVPMPASRPRFRQPVTEVARALGLILKRPVFEKILVKSPGGASLKDLSTREEKFGALGGRLSLHDEIRSLGKWNALLIDDLFDTGASMESAARLLKTYPKVADVFVAALTWK